VIDDGFETRAADGTRLQGTLTLPCDDGESGPAALLISGSGPLDRDSNMPGQVLDIASGLASVLAAHGVGSLRFDKRGVGRSSGDYLTAGFEQETRDAAAALRSLRLVGGVDPNRVVVIGHSVGATIAIRLAATEQWLAGVVALCASIRCGAEVMRWQSERIAASRRGPSRLLAKRFARRQQRNRERLLDSTGQTIRIDGSVLPARWFREYMSYDPQPELASIRCPILAITGRNDVQVDPDDVARIGEIVGTSFTGETPDEITHLLRRHQEPAGLATYRAQLNDPVDPDVLERVASWVKAR
jgi:uncharacterized protein